ncbi:hypothetical protein K440DRAFT_419763 [Wilcoxina mikolae CBS 423.85]|nr:hypothetical protein K440DRAFT_419763 [Wilcoxina mikolae CBS 423.85]
MNIPGEKFSLNLDDLEDGASINESAAFPPVMSFIGDIVEKPTISTPTAPVLPPSATNTTGFPAHKKRIPKNPSRFKQRAQAAAAAPDERTERQRISDDNEARLASMSAEEIEEERRELLQKLSPQLIETLLKRATLDDPTPPPPRLEHEPEPLPHRPTGSRPDPIPKPPPKKATVSADDTDYNDPSYDPDDAAPQIYDESLFPPTGSYHFPTAPQPDTQALDPSSPEFLTALHEKYFPDLPADPSKLAWMTPVSANEDAASYHPSQSELLPSALRFDFKGELLPPRKARELPGHLGLHHHAEAPNAAGYTIPELARLARSTFPTQRCVAMQTLGRIMYKLGTGVYQVPEVENGLWRCLEEGRVLEGLEQAAGMKGGHLSVKAHATEALWLWQKGGGKRIVVWLLFGVPAA